MPPTQTGISECPICGAEVRLEQWTEQHKVHNGLGMQTVAVDQHIDVVGADCNCEWDNDQWDTLLDNAHSFQDRRDI